MLTLPMLTCLRKQPTLTFAKSVRTFINHVSIVSATVQRSDGPCLVPVIAKVSRPGFGNDRNKRFILLLITLPLLIRSRFCRPFVITHSIVCLSRLSWPLIHSVVECPTPFGACMCGHPVCIRACASPCALGGEECAHECIWPATYHSGPPGYP